MPTPMLRVNCWCEQKIIRIPRELVGYTTRSCGPNCRRPPEVTMSRPPQTSPLQGTRRITVNLSAALADWVDEQADSHAHGREIIIERALRDWRRVVERDRANPRPNL